MRVHSKSLFVACLLLLASRVADASDLRLLEAVKSQNHQAVRALLKQRVDVNAPQADGATALHWAAYRNDLETADLLIRAGARVNAANELGVTALSLACDNASAPMVGKLLAAGADPNTIATGEPVLMTAARTGSVEAVKTLLAHGADVNARDTSRGQTALMWAVAHRHHDVIRVLIEHRADVHARSRVNRQLVITGNRYGGVISQERAVRDRGVVEVEQGGSTALLLAARQGEPTSARILIDAGANVNDTAPDGTSALVIASHSGHGELATYLLGKGADPNAADAGYTALHAAVLRGDLALVKALLAKGATVNAAMTKGTPVRRYSKEFALNRSWVGATPYWLATRFAELEIMRALAASGADPRTPADDGTTPLIASISAGVESGPSASDRRERRLDPVEQAAMAESPGKYESETLAVVELAVELGADINAVNGAGDAALHHAASKGFPAVVQFLAAKGADLNIPNKRGQTPLAMTTGRRSAEDDNPRLQAVGEVLRTLGATR